MKKYIIGFLIGLGFIGGTAHALSTLQVTQGGTGATSFNAGNCLKGNGTAAITDGACGGGGSGGGTFSTTTYNGLLIQAPYAQMITSLYQSSTSTSPWWYDPFSFVGYMQGKIGIGSTTPGFPLSVNGSGYFGDTVFSGKLIATSSASIPGLSNLTSNGFVKTSGGIGTLSVDTTSYTPNTVTITVAGTSNQITSSAGTQDLSTNRTWTLSFPNQVIFPQYASTTNGFSTVYGSTTNAFIGTLTLPNLATPAGSFIAVDGNGKVIATTTPSSGSGTVTSVATDSTLTGGTITTTGTLGLNLSNPNTWTGLQTFNYASTTKYASFVTASSTNGYFGTLTLPNITGTQCLHSISGVVSGTGSDCGAGGGGGDSFTHPFVGSSATTSQMLLNGNASTTGLSFNYGAFGGTATTTFTNAGFIGVGTTTPLGAISINNEAGNTAFVVGSTTATSFIINKNGNVGIGSSSPSTALVVNGTIWQDNNMFGFHIGSTTTFGCKNGGVAGCGEIIGNNNTINGGGQLELQNLNAGASAYTGLFLANDMANSIVSNYAGLFLNSSGFNDNSFGPMNNGSSTVSLNNTMGIITEQGIGAINFGIGTSTNAQPSEVARFTSTGLNIGTTTGVYPLTIASSTAPQISLSAGAGQAQVTFRNEGNGIMDISTTTVAGNATSTNPAMTINAGAGTYPSMGIGTSTTNPLSLFYLVRQSGQTTPLLAVASTTVLGGTKPVWSLDANGHVVTSGKTPVCDANCTFSGGNDNAFRIITGVSKTTTTVTFAYSWGLAPVCVANEGGAGAIAVTASSTPTTVVLTALSALTSQDIEVICTGIQ
jgi:hypothetical protein